ncbi:uncharacterized protein LOC126088261 [Schistocerca cancellata]|uniref:uncharacterized protein LOC126088261 n=1 Tax=Schistocerca cancellata TaxID=274614 RepID=UPI002118D01E|nr:uncharacterized protein LOC126088261 [Schistocerca cancellata]
MEARRSPAPCGARRGWPQLGPSISASRRRPAPPQVAPRRASSPGANLAPHGPRSAPLMWIANAAASRAGVATPASRTIGRPGVATLRSADQRDAGAAFASPTEAAGRPAAVYNVLGASCGAHCSSLYTLQPPTPSRPPPLFHGKKIFSCSPMPPAWSPQ